MVSIISNGITITENPELVGKHYPTVEYSIDGSSYTTLDSTGIIIGFDRTNGKEKIVTIDVNATSMTSILCKSIKITGGGRTCNVKIEPATGKVTLE